MKIYCTLFLLSFYLTNTYCQKENILINDILNITAVKSASQITYYGLDFSLLKFISPSNAFNDESVKKEYLGAWLAFYQKEIPPENYIRKWLSFKEGFNYNQVTVQGRIDSISDDWVVVTPTNVTKEQVSKVIQMYDLPESDGLGFVIHPVIFEEITKNVFCFFTFFNIKTKEIYWIAETKHEGIGHGIKQKYGLGMVYSTKIFIDELYKKEMKDK